MPQMQHIWTHTNVFQASDTTVEWSWPVGEGQHYWGYCVRPFQLNSACEIIRQFTTSDNDDVWTEHFVVRTLGRESGGLYRFSALAAIGT